MPEIRKRAWARIDRGALKKNLARVSALCPESAVVPVIKANAYGHGMKAIARTLTASHTRIAALAVASMGEAQRLQELELGVPVLVLNGFGDVEELQFCLDSGLEPVVHSPFQVEILEQKFNQEIFGGKRKFWVKLNSGMNRLGMGPDECYDAYLRLRRFPDVELVLMSHLAWADEPDKPEAAGFTERQIETFSAVRQRIVDEEGQLPRASLAASTGIFTRRDAHLDLVRPGIMLYGGSPLAGKLGEELGLAPVMTLSARLFAINEVSKGEAIGYGATYRCEQDMRVGVVSIGYGDGYPRAAPSGTPVLVKTEEGATRTRLLGRVSMDMITIDLTSVPGARLGDEVVLWGDGLSADEVADAAGTIAYELFCQVTARVPRVYD